LLFGARYVHVVRVCENSRGQRPRRSSSAARALAGSLTT